MCVLLTAVLFDWLTCVIPFEPPFTVKAKRVWGWRGQNPPEVVRSLFAGSKCLKACNKYWPAGGSLEWTIYLFVLAIEVSFF